MSTVGIVGAASVESAKTGNTTDDTQKILELKIKGLRFLTFILENVGSKSLDIKIVTKAFDTGTLEIIELDWTEITAGSNIRWLGKELSGYTEILVKNTTTGQGTTYKLEYICARQ